MQPVKATMTKRCACRGGTLDKFIQPMILIILSRGEQNGYMIIKGMRAFSMFKNAAPDPTGVYRYIKMMESKGLIASRAYVEANGRDKKVYAITDCGRECLYNWKSTLENYKLSIDEIIGLIDSLK